MCTLDSANRPLGDLWRNALPFEAKWLNFRASRDFITGDQEKLSDWPSSPARLAEQK
jgi:hypothetical protein